MILPLRQRHRRVFAVIGVLLPLAFAGGIAARRPVPTVTSLPGPLASSSEKFPVTQWERGDLFTNSPVRVVLAREAADRGRFALQFSAAKDFVKPDLLIYWRPGASPLTESIPDDAVLLGVFDSKVPFRLPPDAAGHSGVVVLYSLADHQFVGVSKPFGIR